MHVPYVNIHTHRALVPSAEEIGIPNVIISKNTLLPQVSSLGIHPWYVDSNPKVQLDALWVHANDKQVVAIGECGLDKLCDTEWHVQEDVFRAQIALANKVSKPLIIHCVRAYQECMQLLRDEKAEVPVLFHGYNRNPRLAQQLLNRGYYLSLGGSICRGKSDALIQELPLDRIFLETDDNPIKIEAIYTYFCGVRKISLEQAKEQFHANYKTYLAIK